MQNLVVVLCRMTTVNLDKSLLCELFKDYGLSLEVLGIDLLNIFKNTSSAQLYLQSLAIDINEMLETSCLEMSYEEVISELQVLLNEISRHLSYISIGNSRLTNIQFQGYDTLILEYIKK